MNYEELVKDLKILFEYDNYEEICYPVIRIYFMYKIDALKKEDMSKYEIDTLEKAYSILVNGRK